MSPSMPGFAMVFGISLACALLASCTRVGLKRIQDSPAYIGKAQLEAFEAEGRTQDEVIAILGPPDARNEKTRGFAFHRCVGSQVSDVSVAISPLFVPIPYTTSERAVTDCEFMAVWFDANGRAVRTGSRLVLYGGDLGQSPPVADICELLGEACIPVQMRAMPSAALLAFIAPPDRDNYLHLYYTNAADLANRYTEAQVYVEAYASFSIIVATSTDFTLTCAASKARDSLSAKMDAAQIAGAEQRAREWIEEYVKLGQSQAPTADVPPCD